VTKFFIVLFFSYWYCCVFCNRCIGTSIVCAVIILRMAPWYCNL